MLNTKYSKENYIEDIPDDCISQFVLENGFNIFEDLCLEIANIEIKNSRQVNRQNMATYKLIIFVYSRVRNFSKKLKLSLQKKF